jgi:hypothetical protein
MPTVPHLNTHATFFARIWTLDVACPVCGTVHVATREAKQRRLKVKAEWDPYLGQFRCRHCGLRLILGVVAWQPPIGAKALVPPNDTVPQPWQQAQLLELLGPGGVMLSNQRRLGYRQEANLFVEKPCTCWETTEPPRARFIDEDCPVHGRNPRPAWVHPDQAHAPRKAGQRRWEKWPVDERERHSRTERERYSEPQRGLSYEERTSHRDDLKD